MREAIVNEGMIISLVNSPQARTKFPFLQHAHRMITPSNRSCCGKRSRTALNVRAVKTTILGMAESELRKLKAHLGVDTLVFFMGDNGGATTRLTR